MEEEIHFPKDIKKTKQRVDIFRVLSAASRPMSAAEIYQCLIKKTDGTNFAISTVYRVRKPAAMNGIKAGTGITRFA